MHVHWEQTSESQHTKKGSNAAAFEQILRRESMIQACYIQLSYCSTVKATNTKFTPERTRAVS